MLGTSKREPVTTASSSPSFPDAPAATCDRAGVVQLPARKPASARLNTFLRIPEHIGSPRCYESGGERLVTGGERESAQIVGSRPGADVAGLAKLLRRAAGSTQAAWLCCHGKIARVGTPGSIGL